MDFITLRENPELIAQAAEWFHSKWGVPEEAYLSCIPEVTKTEVKLVWTPAWTIEKMSRYARIALGIR